MNIQEMIANLMGNKMSKVMRTEDGVTYGPAMTRISRTPISYEELSGRTDGEYDPYSKTIKVDPRKFSTHTATRHEEIHAILDKLPKAGTQQTTSAPGFSDIARVLKPQVAGDMQDEVPAYMAQQQYSNWYGISQQQRDQYVQGLSGQLQKLDPNLAERFNKIANAKTGFGGY